MISIDEYFGPWAEHADATAERRANAERLLDAVGKLEALAAADGVAFPDNPRTGSGVGGTQYGGFRPQLCLEGAPHSSHKEALAVDRYDPHGDIDKWCLANVDKLTACGVYIENPEATVHWSHWTIRAPGSGHRVFNP